MYIFVSETTHWLENDAEFELKKLVWKTIHLKNTSKKKLQVLIINFDNLSNVPYSDLVWEIFQPGKRNGSRFQYKAFSFVVDQFQFRRDHVLLPEFRLFKLFFVFPKSCQLRPFALQEFSRVLYYLNTKKHKYKYKYKTYKSWKIVEKVAGSVHLRGGRVLYYSASRSAGECD